MRDSQLLPVPSSNFLRWEVEERCVAWQCFAFLWTSQVGSTAEAEWIQWWIGRLSKSTFGVFFLKWWKLKSSDRGFRVMSKMVEVKLWKAVKIRFLFKVSCWLVTYDLNFKMQIDSPWFSKVPGPNRSKSDPRWARAIIPGFSMFFVGTSKQYGNE